MSQLEEIADLSFPIALPPTLLEVHQRFDAPKVADIGAATARALEDSGLLASLQPGASVALGVGSRGIANLPAVVKAAVARLRDAGMQPYVVPAMGSHGGATAKGQIGVLADLGVTEESVGAEIRATMEVAEIGRLPDGTALCQGLDSQAADHTILVSRIKPHTDFRSHLESGPSKMSVIGLGKQAGAAMMHAGGGANFQRYLAPAARIYEANTNLAGAICLVENAYDDTAEIAGLTAAQIGLEPEAALLEQAKQLLASLPYEAIDVLVMQEIGKDISGTGMDTNIISRLMIPRQPEAFGNVDVAIIGVLDLTEATHGNASGIGLANVTTARVARKIDWGVTYTNAITAGIFGMARSALPITMADDRRALEACQHGCAVAPGTSRWLFLQNTLTVDRFWVSESLRVETEAHPRLTIAGSVPLAFDAAGLMTSPWALPAAL